MESKNQHVSLGQENPHDDLVLAVALAAWYGENMPRLTDWELAERIAGYY